MGSGGIVYLDNNGNPRTVMAADGVGYIGEDGKSGVMMDAGGLR